MTELQAEPVLQLDNGKTPRKDEKRYEKQKCKQFGRGGGAG